MTGPLANSDSLGPGSNSRAKARVRRLAVEGPKRPGCRQVTQIAGLTAHADGPVLPVVDAQINLARTRRWQQSVP